MGGQPQRRCRRPPREGHAPPSSSYPIRALRGHGAHSVGMCAQLVKKVLTSWWTGKQAPPPLPPSPVFAKIQKIFGRKNCRETLFSLENGIYKNRPVPTLYICTARVGNADRSFPGNPGKSEKSAAPIYGGWFRVLSGGSRWQSALPTGSNWNRALPGRKGCGLLELSRVF